MVEQTTKEVIMRGRRSLPEGMKRKNITITLPPELHEWVNKQSHNISQWMVEVLQEVKTAQESEGKQ